MEKKVVDYSQAFTQIAKTANANIPFKKALNSIAKTATKSMDVAGCAIMLLSSEKGYLTVLTAYGLSDMFIRKGALNAHKSLPEIMKGKIAYIADATRDKRAQYPREAEMENIRSVIGLPLTGKGEIVGEFRVYTHEPKIFSNKEKQILLYAANIISMMIEKYELSRLLEGEKRTSTVRTRRSDKLTKLPPSTLHTSNFSHPSEEKFARLLDFYRLEWLYETRSFPIGWDNGKVIEMFTPDFYLPELDLYIELTTLKQSLITEKNRKIRMLKEIYPEVNIKLLNKGDYQKMLAKYGYAPVNLNKVRGVDHVLFNHSQIQERIRTVAKQISLEYGDKQLILIGVLKGVFCFMADLMRHLNIPVTVEFMGISYYGKDPDQKVKITMDVDRNIAGCHILMVEDIVDTGMTLNYVLKHLMSYNPASLKVCTLLDKRVRRIIDVTLDYTGFEIPDEFVVGYGLDYCGEYRNLPFIGVLDPRIIE